MLASTKHSATAGPAFPAATVPVSTKMPAPTVEPTPKQVSAKNPTLRRRAAVPCGASACAHSTSIGLRASSFEARLTDEGGSRWRTVSHDRRGVVPAAGAIRYTRAMVDTLPVREPDTRATEPPLVHLIAAARPNFMKIAP